MYCPQCGQTQTGEVRYCSRCGLSLYEIGRWLGGDSELTVAEDCTMQLSRRRRHIIRAAKIAFFSGFLCPIGFVIGQAQREPQWLAVPLLVFVSSLIWMLYCRIFMEGNQPASNRSQGQLRTGESAYLPPTSSTIAFEAHPVDTSEIVQPASVTEYTTNLLRNRE